MSGDQANEGIVITGGTVHAGSIAAGRKAQAIEITLQSANENPAQGRQDLDVMIETLHAALREHEGELADRSAAFESLQRVVEELGQEHPAKPTVQQLLSRLSGSAGAVTPVADAVAALDHAVTGLL